jgi:hypothetical protein
MNDWLTAGRRCWFQQRCLVRAVHADGSIDLQHVRAHALRFAFRLEPPEVQRALRSGLLRPIRPK